MLLVLDHGFIMNRNNVICGANDVCMAGNHPGRIHIFISPQILVHWQLIWEILGEKGIKSGLSRGDKQGYWFHCHITFQEWCISGAIYQNGHWAWANNTITKHRSLLQKSHCKYFSAHLNVAKVNSLIVEMGTLCQPGEVTSGERQPKNTHNSTSSVFNTLTLWWREKQKGKRAKARKESNQGLCVRAGLLMQQADSSVCASPIIF